MMVGKRGRPPVKRTSSMTQFTLPNPDPQYSYNPPPRRNSADFSQSAPFLRSCSLCKRRLFPDHDIYMYRGDSAFCSLECRQQQMADDERKDKCCFQATTPAPAPAPAPAAV